ncbi:PHP domain-containing protein [Candidatus Woesearchaeota archaeon]|nr:PHP domain-containing protein [Candidatus Woesearchaeota archaeon]
MAEYKNFQRKVIFHDQALKEFEDDYSSFDMHVHTKYSHDCITNIDAILKRAAQLKIGVAITDHNRAEGALEAYKKKKVPVIPGIEVTSMEKKEILIYFYSANDLKEYYEKYIKGKVTIHKVPRTRIGQVLRTIRSNLSMQEIIDKADKYSCLKSVPHPFNYVSKGGHRFFSKRKRAELFKRIEAVEVFNAAQRKIMNKKALKWAIKSRKAFTGGSDAHNLREVGNAVTACRARSPKDFLECIRKNKDLILGNETRWPAIMKYSFQALKNKRMNGWSKILKTEKDD